MSGTHTPLTSHSVRRRGWWRWARRAILGLVGVVVLAGAGTWGYAACLNWRGDKALSAAMAAVREEGLPASRKEMLAASPGCQRPKALFLKAAFAMGTGTSRDYKGLPILSAQGKEPEFGKPIPADTAEVLREFMAGEHEYFALLEKARQRDERMELIEPLEVACLSHAREAARRWAVASLAAQAEADGERALQCCRNTLWISGTFDGQISILIALPRLAVDWMAVSTLEQALGRCQVEANMLALLKDALEREDRAIDFEEILKGEIAWCAERGGTDDLDVAWMSYGDFRYLQSLEFPSEWIRDPNSQVRMVPAESPCLYRGRLRLRLASKWFWRWLCPGAAKLRFARVIDKDVANLGRFAKPLHVLAKMAKDAREGPGDQWAIPPCGVQALLSGKATLRVAAVAIAVESYRLEYGQWPPGLDPIETDLPDDPFTGQPMKFKQTPDGVVVYSVGPNLIDDGGKDMRAGGDDVTFRLLYPQRRNSP